MLRITQSVSGEGATKYFDAALRTSDYYASELGLWGGRGAEMLGLRGEVERGDFVALASNKVPGSKDQTLTVRTMENRRAGYDFCFSVPKSLSVYLAETKDRVVERMIHESFKETMADIESRMETRVRGKDENGKASVSRELIEKFSKRMRQVEEIAKRDHTILMANAAALSKKTGMDLGDAYAQVKHDIAPRTRERKSTAKLDADATLSNWRSQMTAEERESLQTSSVKGPSQNLLEIDYAKDLAISIYSSVRA